MSAWGKQAERRKGSAGKAANGTRTILRAEELEARELLSVYHLEFSPPTAALATGYTGVSLDTYTAQRGYGWAIGTTGLRAHDTGSGKPIVRYSVEGSDATFLANVPNGYYDVMPSLGDSQAHTVSLWAQGQPLGTVSTQAGKFAHPTYRVQVTNGQLALRVAGVGGSTFGIGALDINVGDGVFEHMNWNQMTQHPTANIQNPDVAGAEIHIPWSVLEPAKGQFNFQVLDRILTAWGAAGKKVTLAIETSPSGAEKNLPGGSATPTWVYDEGARFITLDKKGLAQKIPVLWDPIFQKEFQTFLQQFAARYDGNPALEYLIVGPGVFNSTRAVYPGQLGAYQAAGFTDQRWYQANKQIIAAYTAAFQMTHLALGMAPFIRDLRPADDPVYNEFNLARYAAQQGLYIYYHNLRGTRWWVHSPYPQFLASLGKITKIALGLDNPMSSSPAAQRTYGNPLTTVQYAFGGISGLPAMNTYYVVLYMNDVTAGTRGGAGYQPQFATALSLAWSDLQKRTQAW